MAVDSGHPSPEPHGRIPAWLRGRAGNAVLVLVSIMATALLIEFGAWAWVEFLRPPHLTQWEFRATQPPPYRGAPYFNEEFLRESEAVVRGRLTDVLELDDFRGRYFNVRHGYRVTTDGPLHPVRRVLLFGGSTLFGQEVPDGYTIASYLQRMLTARGIDWQVLNYGLHGMNAAQQTLILRRVELRAGDIVIYYHGVNDIYYLVFGGYREGWVKGTPAFRPVQKLSELHKTLYAWHQRLKDYSYTAEVALDIFQRGQPSTVTDPAALKANLDGAAAQFSDAVLSAAQIARSKGAQFAHFLQPQVFENSPITPYEQTLVENPLLTAPGVETAFRQGYPRLRDAASALAGQGVAFFDISAAFNRRAPGEEILLDFCHVSHRGNELVAMQIFDRYLLPEFRNDPDEAGRGPAPPAPQSSASSPR
jgi:hypothetical protein